MAAVAAVEAAENSHLPLAAVVLVQIHLVLHLVLVVTVEVDASFDWTTKDSQFYVSVLLDTASVRLNDDYGTEGWRRPCFGG